MNSLCIRCHQPIAENTASKIFCSDCFAKILVQPTNISDVATQSPADLATRTRHDWTHFGASMVFIVGGYMMHNVFRSAAFTTNSMLLQTIGMITILIGSFLAWRQCTRLRRESRFSGPLSVMAMIAFAGPILMITAWQLATRAFNATWQHTYDDPNDVSIQSTLQALNALTIPLIVAIVAIAWTWWGKAQRSKSRLLWPLVALCATWMLLHSARLFLVKSEPAIVATRKSDEKSESNDKEESIAEHSTKKITKAAAVVQGLVDFINPPKETYQSEAKSGKKYDPSEMHLLLIQLNLELKSNDATQVKSAIQEVVELLNSPDEAYQCAALTVLEQTASKNYPKEALLKLAAGKVENPVTRASALNALLANGAESMAESQIVNITQDCPSGAYLAMAKTLRSISKGHFYGIYDRGFYHFIENLIEHYKAPFPLEENSLDPKKRYELDKILEVFDGSQFSSQLNTQIIAWSRLGQRGDDPTSLTYSSIGWLITSHLLAKQSRKSYETIFRLTELFKHPTNCVISGMALEGLLQSDISTQAYRHIVPKVIKELQFEEKLAGYFLYESLRLIGKHTINEDVPLLQGLIKQIGSLKPWNEDQSLYQKTYLETVSARVELLECQAYAKSNQPEPTATAQAAETPKAEPEKPTSESQKPSISALLLAIRTEEDLDKKISKLKECVMLATSAPEALSGADGQKYLQEIFALLLNRHSSLTVEPLSPFPELIKDSLPKTHPMAEQLLEASSKLQTLFTQLTEQAMRQPDWLVAALPYLSVSSVLGGGGTPDQLVEFVKLVRQDPRYQAQFPTAFSFPELEQRKWSLDHRISLLELRYRFYRETKIESLKDSGIIIRSFLYEIGRSDAMAKNSVHFAAWGYPFMIEGSSREQAVHFQNTDRGDSTEEIAFIKRREELFQEVCKWARSDEKQWNTIFPYWLCRKLYEPSNADELFSATKSYLEQAPLIKEPVSKEPSTVDLSPPLYNLPVCFKSILQVAEDAAGIEHQIRLGELLERLLKDPATRKKITSQDIFAFLRILKTGTRVAMQLKLPELHPLDQTFISPVRYPKCFEVTEEQQKRRSDLLARIIQDQLDLQHPSILIFDLLSLKRRGAEIPKEVDIKSHLMALIKADENLFFRNISRIGYQFSKGLKGLPRFTDHLVDLCEATFSLGKASPTSRTMTRFLVDEVVNTGKEGSTMEPHDLQAYEASLQRLKDLVKKQSPVNDNALPLYLRVSTRSKAFKADDFYRFAKDFAQVHPKNLTSSLQEALREAHTIEPSYQADLLQQAPTFLSEWSTDTYVDIAEVYRQLLYRDSASHESYAIPNAERKGFPQKPTLTEEEWQRNHSLFKAIVDAAVKQPSLHRNAFPAYYRMQYSEDAQLAQTAAMNLLKRDPEAFDECFIRIIKEERREAQDARTLGIVEQIVNILRSRSTPDKTPPQQFKCLKSLKAWTEEARASLGMGKPGTNQEEIKRMDSLRESLVGLSSSTAK